MPPLEYIRFPEKLLVKLCFGSFRIFLNFCSFFNIFAPQKPPKNHHRCLKEMQRLSKLLVLLKYTLRVLTKFVGHLVLLYLLIFLRLYLVLTMFLPTKYPKIVTGPLNRYGIIWIRLCPLDYISKFPTKLLVKLYFGNFWIFLKSYSLFKVFAP